MIGVSLRHAQAAGLHLKNVDPSIPITGKKALAQTWWTLHSIECVLTSITGRPRIICQKDCTVSLPAALTEGYLVTSSSEHGREKSQADATWLETSSTPRKGRTPFLHAYAQLDILQHKILDDLYSARVNASSWKQMQGKISSLMTELEKWALEALPGRSSGQASTSEPNLNREQLLLYFYYQSVKMCVARPCLCRLEQPSNDQNEGSAEFNRETARSCVQAALDLTVLLPEPSKATWIYEKGPWWSSVHFSQFSRRTW
jgi:hypothetical protein